jgi:putative DNA primase/helicase
MAEFDVKDVAGTAAGALSPRVIDTKNPFVVMSMFADLCCLDEGRRTLYCYLRRFYHWDDTGYRDVLDQSVRDKLYPWLLQYKERVTVKGEEVEAKVKPTKQLLDQMLDALRSAVALPELPRVPCWIDRSGRPTEGPRVVACRNGLFDLDTGLIRKHSPSYFNLRVNAVEYDSEAQCPEWMRFLESALDTESISVLQEMFGYLVSGDTRQQKAFLLIGKPRSGRGTILRVLEQLTDCVATSFTALGGGPFGAENLIGRGCALMGDTRVSTKVDEQALAMERFLRITGEDLIDVPRKNLSTWSGRLPTRFVMLSNVVPRIADPGGAFATRFVVLYFPVSWLGREDVGLRDRLHSELAGIFNWAVEGLRRLTARGGAFVQPSAAQGVVMKFRALSGAVGAFLTDWCERTGNVQPMRLYEAWVVWCGKYEREPGTEEEFGRALRLVLPELWKSRPRVDGERPWFYEGISLKDGWDKN